MASNKVCVIFVTFFLFSLIKRPPQIKGGCNEWHFSLKKNLLRSKILYMIYREFSTSESLDLNDNGCEMIARNLLWTNLFVLLKLFNLSFDIKSYCWWPKLFCLCIRINRNSTNIYIFDCLKILLSKNLFLTKLIQI